MDEHAWLAERFEEHRTPLRAVAYTGWWGSLAEADEAVQDAWLRVSRLGAGEIDMGGSSGIISLSPR
jgi:RNA polymerase sigma-70 factor, ECF subfamily